jgi:hypothetical protein
MGGFIWVFALAALFLYQGKHLQGLLGIALVAAAGAAIVSMAPWRFPSTPYWKLMLAPYGVFLLSIVWAVWSYGGIDTVGWTWWHLIWLLPMVMPFGLLSQRKWEDAVAQPGAATDTALPRR